jgi:hypothetical protein
MKQAITIDGRVLIASHDTPPQAICPHCGGTVHLRRRRRMNNDGTSFFWRHLNNSNRDCRARAHLIQYTPLKITSLSNNKSTRF